MRIYLDTQYFNMYVSYKKHDFAVYIWQWEFEKLKYVLSTCDLNVGYQIWSSAIIRLWVMLISYTHREREREIPTAKNMIFLFSGCIQNMYVYLNLHFKNWPDWKKLFHYLSFVRKSEIYGTIKYLFLRNRLTYQ